MQAENFLKCSCHNCGGHIEFPSEAAGQIIACPHCHWETELRVEKKRPSAATRRKTLAGGLVISAALAGALAFGIYAARRNSPQPKSALTSAPAPRAAEKIGPEDPDAQVKHRKKRARPAANAVAKKNSVFNGFSAGDVTIENSGGRLVYAVGTLANDTTRQRFGVKVHLNLFDANGKKIGETTDYTQIVEPQSEWRFKALVVDPKVARAEIASVEEN